MHQVQALVNLPLACKEFDQKLEILYANMTFQIIDVLDPFLAFAFTFNLGIAHNMCIFQLDPYLKAFIVSWNMLVEYF
jgi:hypothetical protein